MQRTEQISVDVEVVVRHLRSVNEGHGLAHGRIGKCLPMVKWNDFVLSTMQDERGASRTCHLDYILEALGDKDS